MAQREKKIGGFNQRKEKRTLKHLRKLKVSCLQDGKWMMLAYKEDGQKTDINTDPTLFFKEDIECLCVSMGLWSVEVMVQV